MCREAWFSECIVENMFKLDGVFITKQAHNDYVGEVYPFQKLSCVVSTKNIKKASFDVVFEFFNVQTNKLVSRGYQIIVYASKTKKIQRLENHILNRIRQYQKAA